MRPPFPNNPLRTHADIQEAVRTLVAPLAPYFSPSAARVRLGATGAHFSDSCAELEGFARPLWGLGALAAGGGAFDGWERYRRGIVNGTDPHHPEYWGDARDRDQRLVEMAPIAFALALAPEQLWEPLDTTSRANFARWLNLINQRLVPDNNWLFFQVIVNLALRRVGAPYDPTAMHTALDRLESFALDDGWYSDGPTVQRDYYVPFAIHYGGLIYARLAGDDDPARAARFRERAATFAHQFACWFADDGAALPFGRSLTYRFAQGAFWGALAFADVAPLPWGVIKGLALRHLRWWARQPICNADGTLTIGYAYPNLTMAETYNSPGSPYWGMKFFLPLALPETHPFWQADEAPLPALPAVQPQPAAGMVVCRDASSDHVFALSGAQYALWARHGAAKYAKFAYSTAFGFSVPSATYELAQTAPDSTLALSDDGIHYRVRESLLETHIKSETIYTRWSPWPDVTVETWLIPHLPWHIRIHRLRTDRTLWSAEGGFALDRTGDDPPDESRHRTSQGYALAIYPAGASGLRDLRGERTGEVLRADPNTNLLVPRTVIPLLRGEHAPGEHWLICAVLARPGSTSIDAIWDEPPQIDRLLTSISVSDESEGQ